MSYLRPVTLERRVRETLKPGRFYTRQSIVKLVGGSSRVNLGDLKNLLQRFRKEGFMTYDKALRFWTMNASVKESSEKKMNVDFKKSELEIISRFESLSEEIVKKTLKKLIPLAAEQVESVMKSMARGEIVDVVEDDERFKEVIEASTKESVREQFRLEVIPTLLTNIRDRVEQEVVTRMTTIRSDMDKLKEEVKYIRAVMLKGSKQYTKFIHKYLGGRNESKTLKHR